MNKLVIPSILTAAVLVAATFAFMPIQKASTIHTTLLANRVVSVTYKLDGLTSDTAGVKAVVLDVTPLKITQAHIAATLPSVGGACGVATIAPIAGLTVNAGVAPTLTPVILGAHNTGLVSTTGSSCVYHRTITPSDVTGSAITDIVVINSSGSVLPDDAIVTVTATVST